MDKQRQQTIIFVSGQQSYPETNMHIFSVEHKQPDDHNLPYSSGVTSISLNVSHFKPFSFSNYALALPDDRNPF